MITSSRGSVEAPPETPKITTSSRESVRTSHENIPSKLSVRGAKRDVEDTPKCALNCILALVAMMKMVV